MADMTTTRTRARTTVPLLLLLATSALSADCDAAPYQGVRAEAQSRQSKAGVTLEFDLPDEFSARAPDGNLVVTGFRVGAFRPGESNPVATVDVTRDEVSVNGRTGRISFDRNRLTTDVKASVLRVQTLTRENSSLWSEPSSLVGASAKVARATPRKRDVKGVSMPDVERHPKLLEALRKVLPSDVKPEDVAARFRTVDLLAVSVVISEQENIPLDKLSALIKGPPPRNLRAALRELQPSLESRALVRKARQQSRALLDGSKK
jgi:hypothetical protein